MKTHEKIFSALTRVLYSIAALALTLISLAMIGAAGLDVWRAFESREPLKQSLLDGIGLVVVSLAVFDVAKYLMEEEVLRDRELRSASEARETLTKFIVVIVIALTLEALVFVLGAASTDLSLLVFPAILFAVSSLMVVSLAVYLRLSSNAEQRLNKPR
ncbi:MAG: hypothetical protein K9L70_04660 [Thiohalocapsa sp.]|jgi:hypothetical protein|nr:hypothetical protein [Thiohalocapsa sp.]MCF7991497.1 hypothetical protein [Thiohalocapsa sp.]